MVESSVTLTDQFWCVLDKLGSGVPAARRPVRASDAPPVTDTAPPILKPPVIEALQLLSDKLPEELLHSLVAGTKSDPVVSVHASNDDKHTEPHAPDKQLTAGA